jgi:hypothetical protein
MVQSWWPILLAVWLAVTLPVFLALNLAISDPFWPIAAFWWFKPLYDRALLHVLSRAVFGATPTLGETLRALPGVFRRSGLLWHLTLGRLDVARSFKLPVYQLEGLKGKTRRARLQVMGARGGGYGAGISVICIHLESFTYIGFFALIYLMIPGSVELNPFEALIKDDGEYALFWNFLAYLAATLIEPFYVACGFSLYLNRRTVLEAWDLELNLRRLAARLQALSTASPPAIGAILICASLTLGSLLTQDVHAALADTPIGQYRDSADPQAKIEKVLADADFGGSREVTRWKPKDPPEKEEKDSDDDSPNFDWLTKVGRFFGEVIEVIGWAIAAVAIIALGVYLFRNAAPIRETIDGWRTRRHRVQMPSAVAGLELEADALPLDIEAGARALWQEGNPRAAMSMLYRGAIVALLRNGMWLPESATEGDILRRASQRLAQEAFTGLQQLVFAWQRLAYAHRGPGAEEFEALCVSYQKHLAQSEPTQTSAPQT